MSTKNASNTKATSNTNKAPAPLAVMQLTQIPKGAHTLEGGNKAKPIDGKAINQFVNQHAGGQLTNVYVLPLGNVADQPPYTPFGCARPNGTRAMYHKWHVKGMQTEHGVTNNLGLIARAMRKHDGHSLQRLICTAALLNGGYSTSTATYGTPFIKLVAVPPKQ